MKADLILLQCKRSQIFVQSSFLSSLFLYRGECLAVLMLKGKVDSITLCRCYCNCYKSLNVGKFVTREVYLQL